jgi:hypothetical protein
MLGLALAFTNVASNVMIDVLECALELVKNMNLKWNTIELPCNFDSTSLQV